MHSHGCMRTYVRACYTCPHAWCGCIGANERCARRCVEYSKFRQTTESITLNMRCASNAKELSAFSSAKMKLHKENL